MTDRMDRMALLSPDGVYRYTLTRRWAGQTGDGNQVLWIMLNPSTADAFEDDQTVRKCIGFSHRWGYDALMIVNLFALRSRDPKLLLTHPDPIGPDNHYRVNTAIKAAPIVVLGWGGFRSPRGRLQRLNVEEMCRRSGKAPLCLGKTATGAPKHPVLLGYDTPLEEYGG